MIGSRCAWLLPFPSVVRFLWRCAAAMDPSAAELLDIAQAEHPLGALLNFVGMQDDVKAAVWHELGGAEKIREIVFVPLADWEASVASAKVPIGEGTDGDDGGRPAHRGLKPREKAQVGMLRRYARLLVGLPGDEGEGALTQGGARATVATVAPGKSANVGTGKRKFKLASVVDQKDDQEVDAIGAEGFRDAIKRFKEANDGLNPAEDEEATPDQLQGIAVKLSQDVVPYADFGVLRPFGLRLERTLKFHAKFWDPSKAEFVAKELPGPPSIDEWLRSWKVYTFILVALGAASRARLERYRDKVVALANKYGQIRGGSWWIIALADQRMRSERMERIRRELEAAAFDGRLADAGGLDRERPWDAVFLRAAQDHEFWQAEVVEVSLLYAAKVKDRAELTDPGHHVWVAGEAKRTDAVSEAQGRQEAASATRSRARRDREKRKHTPAAEAVDKRATGSAEDAGNGKGGKAKGKGKSRIQVCYAWNRDAAGCPNPCPNGRAHVCEACGSVDHKGKACPAR